VLRISIAVTMINVKSALDAWWKLASIFSGGMLGLFLLGYMAPKVKNSLSIVFGTVAIFIVGFFAGNRINRFIKKIDIIRVVAVSG